MNEQLHNQRIPLHVYIQITLSTSVYNGRPYDGYSVQVRGGVVVCNSCYGEVDKIINFVNNGQKEKSISYPADTNWGGRWAEMMEDKEDFHNDLADAFKKGIYSDIQVKPSSGPPLRAHKVLLATRSEILKHMLASDWCKAAPEDSISLPEFSSEELDTFMEFLYRGDLAVEKFQKHCGSLLIAADKHDIAHLQKFSELQLVKLLNSSNALKILEISDVVSNETIKLAALKLIVLRYKDIVLTPSFDEFAKKNPHLMEVMNVLSNFDAVNSFFGAVKEKYALL
ncbi:BTB/POZ domain-containing protein At1g01640-like [Papaver somniferum]|uniref:BTB/POZ domain-containing protein At1g01640-like n=1 Tax=Papaver somniferum TaxID=3469 RepID=UPI000E6F6A24|nr:BTB/POZ domain-containing protein At1g01640-like [Papaver somniferum]